MADSVPKEQRQNLPDILSPQRFEYIPAKGTPIEVRTKNGGTIRVKTVARYASRTNIIIHVVPIRIRKK